MAQFYGNEQIQHTLHQMLLRDRAPHGFLFYGETGLGKKTLAKQFLAELLCTGTEKPCGSCKSCKMLADGVHPDVRFVEHSGKRNGFSVDTVREVCVDLASPPNEGNAKCYVFGDCDAMDTRTQNLLLKAVEEPPAYGYFIFTATSPASLLPTVRSRIVSLAVSPVTEQECCAALAERGFSPAFRTLTVPSASTTKSTQEQPSSSPRKSRISLGIVTCPLMVKRCDICFSFMRIKGGWMCMPQKLFRPGDAHPR